MIHKHGSSIPGHVCVIFELPASVWADRIYLTGDFNNWCEHDLPLQQERDGAWRVALHLPAGQRFQFRYLVDGQWQTDWCADGKERNTFGSQNSVVVTDLPGSETIPPPHTSNWIRYPLPANSNAGWVEQVQTRPAA